MKRAPKVFLCHAHVDAVAVRDLYLYLRREGVDVWLDKEKLLPGADWDYEIRKAVREADAIVVCLSKQFNQDGYRQKEVRLALDTEMEKPQGEIFIIPARLEECENLPSLRKWQYVDLFEPGGRRKLIDSLRKRAERVGASLRKRRGAPSVTSGSQEQETAKIAESPISDKGDLLAHFINLGNRLRIVLVSRASRHGMSTAGTTDFPNVLIFLRDTGSMEPEEYYEIDQLDKLYYEVLHGETDYNEELTPRMVNRMETIVDLYEDLEGDI